MFVIDHVFRRKKRKKFTQSNESCVFLSWRNYPIHLAMVHRKDLYNSKVESSNEGRCSLSKIFFFFLRERVFSTFYVVYSLLFQTINLSAFSKPGYISVSLQ